MQPRASASNILRLKFHRLNFTVFANFATPMSAFMMVATAALIPTVKSKRKDGGTWLVKSVKTLSTSQRQPASSASSVITRSSSHMSRSSPMMDISKRSETSMSSDSALAHGIPAFRTSTNMSQATTTAGGKVKSKQIFDSKTLKYINEQDSSPYRRLVYDFTTRMQTLCTTIVNHDANENLNGGGLFTVENVNRLRFSYFEAFECDYNEVNRRLTSLPKPKYWLMVWDLDAINTFQLFYETSDETKHLLKVRNRRREREGEIRLRSGEMVKNDFSPNGVRELLCQLLFWEDVYQDIRYELAAVAYIQWIPTIEFVQRFFIELIDHCLSNLHILACTGLEKCSAEEQDELRDNYYYYYNDADWNFFGVLTLALESHFRALMGSYYNRGHVHEAMKLLATSLCDNLKIHYYGRHGVQHMIGLWSEFLVDLVDLVLTRKATSKSVSASMVAEVDEVVLKPSIHPQVSNISLKTKRFGHRLRFMNAV